MWTENVVECGGVRAKIRPPVFHAMVLMGTPARFGLGEDGRGRHARRMSTADGAASATNTAIRVHRLWWCSIPLDNNNMGSAGRVLGGHWCRRTRLYDAHGTPPQTSGYSGGLQPLLRSRLQLSTGGGAQGVLFGLPTTKTRTMARQEAGVAPAGEGGDGPDETCAHARRRDGRD